MKAHLVIISACIALTATSYAQIYSVSLGTSQRGWVGESGSINPSNGNYFTGKIGGSEYRSYYKFDLSSLVGSVLSANLTFDMPTNGVVTGDGSELFGIRQVTSNIDSITSPAIFTDLGDGDIYGAANIAVGSGDVTVDLGSSFIDLLNAGGSSVTVGGHLLSLDNDDSNNEYVFFSSEQDQNAVPSPVQLNLTLDATGDAVPEPSSALLLCLAGFGFLSRRRR